MEKNISQVKAINKNVRTSPRKLALVCNFIKGKKADVALRDLEFSRKRIAKDVSKTVKSAISNAENNYQFDIDNLFVKEAYVGKSLVMKRFRPRAKGRASPIKKPFSRITIILEEIQTEMLKKAKIEALENTIDIESYDEFKMKIEKGGFFNSPWCGKLECEEKIKEETGAEIRVIPFNSENTSKKCIYCKEQSTSIPIFARGY